MARLVLALCVALVSRSTLAADLASTWAILATPEIEQAGVSDLLFATLAEQDLDLVERQDLDVILKELELAALGGAGGAGQRLKVGPQVGADGLILLSVESSSPGSAADTKRLKLVICESRFGTRLRVEYRPWPASDPETLCSDLSDVLSQTRQRFPHGIQRVIGVGPFLSQNLLHDFDYLQSGFAALLTQGLSAYRGVAVIEIEEARAIGRELDLSGRELKDRVVPIVLEGEYRMAEQAKSVSLAEAELAVSVKSAASDGEAWDRQSVSISGASEWLSSGLPGRILKLTDSQTRPLTRRQQYEALTRRADMFALVGSLRESLALRESAVLLADDLVQNLRLIRDYRRYFRMRPYSPHRVTSQDPEERLAQIRQLELAERAMIERYVQLIERRLAAGDVSVVEGGLLWNAALIGINAGQTPEERVRRHELKRRVYWDNIPRLKRLDATIRDGDLHPELRQALEIQRMHKYWTPTPAGQTRVWTNQSIDQLLALASRRRYAGLPQRPELALQDAERLIEQSAPWPLPPLVLSILPRPYSRRGGGEFARILKSCGLSDEGLTAFYERLAASGHPLKEVYGRIGLLSGKLEMHKGTPPQPPAPELITELKLLQGRMADYATDHPHVAEAAEEVRMRLVYAEVLATRGWSAYMTWRSKQYQYTEPSVEQLREHARWVHQKPATIRFEPVENVTAIWDRLVPCGPGLDVVYRGDELWFMREPGRLESVFRRPTEKDHIQSAQWDGRWLWVTNDLSGLRVFDRSGRMLGHLPPAASAVSTETDSSEVTQKTLPPYRRGNKSPSDYRTRPGLGSFTFASMVHHFTPLRLCPLGDGRCVVAGTTGELKRLWICLVGLDDSDEWSVDLVHQGRKIPVASDESYMTDADFAFDPSWMVPMTLPGSPSRDVVLIGRNRTPINSRRLPPLVLELESGTVSVLPAHFTSENNRTSPVVEFDGHLLHKGRYLLESLHPSSDGEWKLTVMNPSHRRYDKAMQGPLLQIDDETFLVPDHVRWTRIHTRPYRLEYLKRDLSQPWVSYHHYGVSSHYGPVAWQSDGTLMRAVFEPADATR